MSYCLKDYRHKYYIANKERLMKQNEKYRLSHLEQIKESQRIYAQKHPEMHSKANKKYLDKNKMICFTHYSGNSPKCADCGIEDMDVLTFDHINGNGREHRKQIGSGSNRLHIWLIKNNFPEGFQVLCFNCNWKKRLKEMN